MSLLAADILGFWFDSKDLVEDHSHWYISSLLYRVAADIATRPGIAEGLILAPEHEDKKDQVPANRS